MKAAAIKRKLRGEPTGRETDRERRRLSTPRKGDKVIIEDLGEVEILKNPAFGKTRVRDAQGNEHVVDWGDIKKPEATVEEAIESLRKQAEEGAKHLLELRVEPDKPAERDFDKEIAEKKEGISKLEEKLKKKKDFQFYYLEGLIM